MAEAKKPQTTKSDTKRRVKDPETFRERAIKANETSGRPTKKSRVGSILGAPFKLVSKQLGKLFSAIYKNSPKVLQKVFRGIGLVLLPRYIRNSWKELKLVTWPTWPQARRLTFAVMMFAITFGVVIAGVDYVLNEIFQKLLLS